MSDRPWGFAGAMGVRVVESGGGAALVECEVGADHLNLGGTVHGGVVATLVDVAVAVALHTMDPEGTRRPMATTDLNVAFLLPSSTGPLSCRARIRRRGRSLAVGEAEVTDGAGRLMAVGRATYLVGGARPAPGGTEADDAMGMPEGS